MDYILEDRRVIVGGTIRFLGKRYLHPALEPHVGEIVSVLKDEDRITVHPRAIGGCITGRICDLHPEHVVAGRREQ